MGPVFSEIKARRLAFLLAMLLVAAMLALTLFSNYFLPEILENSRIVLCNKESQCSASVFKGEEQLLQFPGPPPEGTFLLADTALTHRPGANLEPMPNPIQALAIKNGAKKCQRYGRIKKARVEALWRRANDPDQEFIIPEARAVFVRELFFPDTCQEHVIQLRLPVLPESRAYPLKVFLHITKITVLEIYPGEVEGIVALSGLQLR